MCSSFFTPIVPLNQIRSKWERKSVDRGFIRPPSIRSPLKTLLTVALELNPKRAQFLPSMRYVDHTLREKGIAGNTHTLLVTKVSGNVGRSTVERLGKRHYDRRSLCRSVHLSNVLPFNRRHRSKYRYFDPLLLSIR